ncbi:MAG: FN3 associated domain-containing protein, partial [Alloprevotella sp.]|nr:FN3 associated domain-containing protein [Alloprevotella sp.]
MNSFVKTLCIIFLILFASLSANAGGTYYVKVGEEKMLSFTPKSGFLNNTMAWRSYDTSCVSVKGPQYTSYTYVKALAATTSARGALVQCEYKYMWNGFALTATEDFYIIVEDNTPKEPTGISMQSSLTLNVGDSYTLYPTVYPSGVSTSITWSTNNRNVASVTSGGRVTGESEGTATIYATTHNGYYTSCNVTVTKPTATVSISNTNTLLTKPTKIALKSTPTSANIYYTLDGSTPTTSSSLYSDSLLINKNTTLKAIAVASGYYDSPVLTKEFEYTTLDVVDTYPANGVAIIMRSKLTPIIKFNQRIYKGENFDNIKITNGSSPIIGEFAIAYDALYFKPENEFKSGKISLTIPKDAVMTDNNEINPEVRFTFEIKDTLRCVNMSASTSHTIATKNDGSLWAWGYNSYGQLGDGTTTNKTTPIKIMDNVVSTSASRYHSLAIKNDGSLWAWGRNSYGQLGDGTTTNKTTPVKIMDNVVSTSAGLYHSLAIKNDGSLWAWGDNSDGQLGDGTTTNKTTPVKIMDNVV